MYSRILFSIAFLMSTAASAAIVVKNLEQLDEKDQRKVFQVLTQRKHDLERPDAINADLSQSIPGKNVEAYWVPDTLYQVAQCFVDVEGMGQYHEALIPFLQSGRETIDPIVWKKMRQDRKIMYFSFPTALEDFEIKSPSTLKDWARFNNKLNGYLRGYGFDNTADASQRCLTNIINDGPRYQANEVRLGWADYKTHTTHLKANMNFLRHAIKVEEDAHKEGKLLLWRYSQPLPGNIPDMPFTIQENSLDSTLNKPLENHAKIGDRISYANRLLEGFFGDGMISGQPYFRGVSSACTFSFLANDTLAKENGHIISNPILYSLALDPGKVHEFYEKMYLYYPRAHMPQYFGIYGTGEAFHASWIMEMTDHDNTKAWLDLMKSESLRVHYSNGVLQEDYKTNAETIRLRNIYGQFFDKVDRESPKKLFVGITGDVVDEKGTPLVKKITARGPALQGNVESLMMSNGTLKLSGWSADIEKGGPSKTVTILYKNREVGVIAVDQPRDLNSHFGGYKILGNYSKVGFGGTFGFPESNDPNFDPTALKVIARGYDGDVNFLYVPMCGVNAPSIGERGQILSENGGDVEIKKTVRGDAVQGNVQSLTVDQKQRKIYLFGWSANVGKEKASKKVNVFYKRKLVGQGEVNQPSPSIAGHYAHYSIPGDYGMSGFNFTVDFPWWMNAVNADDIQVVAYGEDGDANFVYIDKAKVVIQ